jgi:hypothetical protein
MLRPRPHRSTVGFIEPCLPSVAIRPPKGPGWIHEIKVRCIRWKSGGRAHHHDHVATMRLRCAGQVREFIQQEKK